MTLINVDRITKEGILMAYSIADDHTNPTQQRTVLLATDNKNSVLAEVIAGRTNRMAYSAYGHQSAQQEVMTRLGFNGELREAKIGWYLLGNGYRAYNPRLMRFHSPDSWSPFGGGGLNAYMYCVGDPVNHSDPTGHVPWIEPGVKKFLGNTLKFFFGGSDITGPSRTRALNATQGTGRTMSREHGDLAAMSNAAKAVYAGAPTVVTTGKYRPKGDGSTHGMKWGATPPYLQTGAISRRTGYSAQPTRAPASNPQPRSSFDSPRKLYVGPDPQYVRRPREEVRLLGRAPDPNNHYYKFHPPRMEHPRFPTPPPRPRTPPRSRSPSPWRRAMARTDAEMQRAWDYDSD